MRPTSPENKQDAIGSSEFFLGNGNRSKQDIINQLVFANGFSVEDATFAANAVDLDFDAAAVDYAEVQLEINDISEQVLFYQIHFAAQFTAEEALQAIETLDPDFVAEAVAATERTLELNNGVVPRGVLFDFLTDDFLHGFTPSVANEAMDRAGIE